MTTDLNLPLFKEKDPTKLAKKFFLIFLIATYTLGALTVFLMFILRNATLLQTILLLLLTINVLAVTLVSGNLYTTNARRSYRETFLRENNKKASTAAGPDVHKA